MDILVLAIGPDEPDKPDALPREMVAAAESAGVRFLGMRDDVDRLYAAMDIFVAPLAPRGLSPLGHGGGRDGLPVVADRHQRMSPGSGRRSRPVLLVPVEDPEALRAAITAIGDSPEARREMGIEGSSQGRGRIRRATGGRDRARYVRRAGRSKGLARLLPVTAPGCHRQIRPARPGDAPVVAGLHAEIATGFLPRLGRRFLRRLYRALIEWPGADVFVAEDRAGPVGFVAATSDTSAFYRFFLRRHGLFAAFAALPRLVRPR